MPNIYLFSAILFVANIRADCLKQKWDNAKVCNFCSRTPRYWKKKNTASNQFRYDYTYNESVQGWLKMHVMPTTFNEAFLICKAEGSTLASPITENLRDAMIQKFRGANTESCALYTGVHATVSKGAFSSIEGVPLGKIPTVWAPSEPDNYKNNEDCIVMLPNGTMADTTCTDTFPFVCYKRNTPNLVINECGTTDPEYKLNNVTGSCYKLHTNAHTWGRAYMICMAEGGHLAVINSEAEARFLANMFTNTPSASIKSTFTLSASIGFRDWSEHTMWMTVQGETLQEAGYAEWAPGEPNNIIDVQPTGGEYCGSILRDKPQGILNDVSCKIPLAFICEMVPNTLNNH